MKLFFILYICLHFIKRNDIVFIGNHITFLQYYSVWIERHFDNRLSAIYKMNCIHFGNFVDWVF